MTKTFALLAVRRDCCVLGLYMPITPSARVLRLSYPLSASSPRGKDSSFDMEILQ